MLESALILVLFLVLGAEFVNGATDAPNAIATVVSTRVLRPWTAIALASVLNLLGALLGTGVALTIANGFVDIQAVTLTVVAAAVLAIILWSSLAWWFGIPTSESHALVSGLTGAGLAVGGAKVLIASGWTKVLLGLVISTVGGFALGHLLIVIVLHACRSLLPQTVRLIFGRLQIVSASLMALGHGTNDGQKFIGAFVLAMILGGAYPKHLRVDDPGDTNLRTGALISPQELDAAKKRFGATTKQAQGATTGSANRPRQPQTHLLIPVWIRLLCAAVMAVGTSVGGWRIIRTMGLRMVKLEPYHGFAAETAAYAAIQLGTVLHIPLSTTQTISASILGVGAARRLSAVRWGIAGEFVTAWILTFPVCGLIAYAVAWLLHRVVPAG